MTLPVAIFDAKPGGLYSRPETRQSGRRLFSEVTALMPSFLSRRAFTALAAPATVAFFHKNFIIHCNGDAFDTCQAAFFQNSYDAKNTGFWRAPGWTGCDCAPPTHKKLFSREQFMKQGVPVLLYHRIDHSGLSTATPPKVFRRHLQWLSERNWRALSAEEFGYYMRTGKAFPSRTFVMTFDDGYESLVTTALPVLQEFRCPAIAFLATGLLSASEAPVAATRQEASPFLSWQQIRETQTGGWIDFQSHTHSHPGFAGWTTEQIAADLTLSVDLLTQQLALPRSHFTHLAWPWGVSKPAWRAAAMQAGFRYQYTVARNSFRMSMPQDTIPRTCFDAAALTRFQCQFWLQSGQFAPVWEAAYPFGKKLRQLGGLLG